MKKYFFALIIGTCLFGCKPSKEQNNNQVQLTMDGLFSLDSVAYFIKYSPASLKDSSQRIFLNAINLLVNQSNPVQAASLFIKSLLIYPNATGYYELGNAYLESGKYNEALLTYKMAERLDYKPLNVVLFKQACCYAENDDEANALDYLSYSIENGFVKRDKIFNEPHFKKIRNQTSFVETYNQAMEGNGNPEAILWEGYKSEFSAISFPLTIDTGSYRSLGNTETISYDYEKFVTEMRDNKFSRDVGNEFFYFAKIAASDSNTIVIYGSRGYALDEEATPVYYYLASFDNKGILIDKKLIAGHKLDEEPMKVCKFIDNNKFEISIYENSYEKLKNKEGFEFSKVKDRKLIKTEKYTIDSKGKLLST